MGGRKTGQQPFPYPVFGRFSYILSALVGHKVRQYQTACTRTAGHWISEKSAVLFCATLFFCHFVKQRTVDSSDKSMRVPMLRKRITKPEMSMAMLRERTPMMVSTRRVLETLSRQPIPPSY